METRDEEKRSTGSMARRWVMFMVLIAGAALIVVGVLKWSDLYFLTAGGVGMAFLACIWGGLFLDGQPTSVRVTLLAFAGLVVLMFLIALLSWLQRMWTYLW